MLNGLAWELRRDRYLLCHKYLPAGSNPSEPTMIQKVVSPNLSPPVEPSHSEGGATDAGKMWIQSQDGGEAADSLPLGSGNPNFTLGRASREDDASGVTTMGENLQQNSFRP